MNYKICAFLLFFAGYAAAESVKFSKCSNEVTKCSVDELVINPCPEASTSNVCKVKRGRNSSIEFNFTPEFDATSLHNLVYWASPEADIPFVGIDADGCRSTNCPIAQGEVNNFKYTIPIHKKYPVRSYDVKWVLRNPDTTEEACCLLFKIQITR